MDVPLSVLDYAIFTDLSLVYNDPDWYSITLVTSINGLSNGSGYSRIFTSDSQD